VLLSAVLQEAVAVRSAHLPWHFTGLLLPEADAWCLHRLRAVNVR